MPDENRELVPDMSGRRRARASTPDVMAYAAPRERTLDEHNYHAEDNVHRGSFRLQLFTADAARPVAVATQQWKGGGADDPGPSLTNGAEDFAAVVWQRHFPHAAEPPVWIQLTIEAGDALDLAVVTFAVDDTGPHRLENPEWERLTAKQLDALVRSAVDATRGRDYLPVPPEPEEEPNFTVVEVASLAPSRPRRDPGCMPQQPATPAPWSDSCCWYHGGNWQRVSDIAIDLVNAAEDAGVSAEGLWPWATEQGLLAGRKLSDWEAMALKSLLVPSIAIYPFEDGGGYVNGQHRARAMQDQGVERTVVVGSRFRDDDRRARGPGGRRCSRATIPVRRGWPGARPARAGAC